jgi:hypothetical protein
LRSAGTCFSGAPPQILIRHDFDEHWIVAGDDTERVRGLFDDALIEFVEMNKWWMEADGNRLALYRWNHTVNHTFLEDFFHQAFKALLLLKSRSAAVASESRGLVQV